LEEVGLSHS
jgi:hypothetical protein